MFMKLSINFMSHTVSNQITQYFGVTSWKLMIDNVTQTASALYHTATDFISASDDCPFFMRSRQEEALKKYNTWRDELDQAIKEILFQCAQGNLPFPANLRNTLLNQQKRFTLHIVSLFYY